MEEELKILAICTHEGIRETILRLLKNHSPQWQATGAETSAQATEFGNTHHYDVVLLGNGLTEQEEQELTNSFTSKHDRVKMVKHYGGGSGLLFGEIYQALNN